MSLSVSRRADDLITKKNLIDQHAFIDESTNELRKESEKKFNKKMLRILDSLLNL